MFFFFSLCTLLFSINAFSLETKFPSTNKFWVLDCRLGRCEEAFETCATNRCIGKEQCQRCVTNVNKDCERCVRDLFDDNELVDGRLLCDPADPLQVNGCKIYCRGNLFIEQEGQCVYDNGWPICQCQSNQPITTTRRQSTRLLTTARIQCKDDEYFDSDQNACLKKKTYNEICSISSECDDVLECKNNICKCPENLGWNGDECD